LAGKVPPDAIITLWPATTVQLCVAHLVRANLVCGEEVLGAIESLDARLLQVT